MKKTVIILLTAIALLQFIQTAGTAQDTAKPAVDRKTCIAQCKASYKECIASARQIKNSAKRTAQKRECYNEKKSCGKKCPRDKHKKIDLKRKKIIRGKKTEFPVEDDEGKEQS